MQPSSLSDMLAETRTRRERDAERFAQLDRDLCMLCGAYGADKRSLFIACLYDIQEVIPEAIDVWATTYTELQLQMPRETFDAWLLPSRLLSVSEENGTAVYHVGVLNERAQEWLEQRLKKVVLRTLGSVARMPVDVVFEVVSHD